MIYPLTTHAFVEEELGLENLITSMAFLADKHNSPHLCR
jgi:hypothetical protein